MKFLVFGRTGQVATELARFPGVVALGRTAADLTTPEACAARIAGSDADAIINAAAYTAVDKAESEPDLAGAVNGTAPGAMAQAAARRGLPFVHISTEYVFDGAGTGPWHPADATAPLGSYGRSKLAGEHAVRAAGGTFAILRTSWVFSAHGSNFVRSMLRLGRERDRLAIVADQIGGPTPASAIAQALLSMARAFHEGRGVSGTYHFAGAPETSWAGFARAIFAQAGLAVQVDDIPSADYPTPSPRPLNSRLDCSSLQVHYGLTRPDWRAGLTEVLKELDSAT